MTQKGIRKFIPDTPKEFAFLGGAVGRLGVAMSGITLMQEDHIWTFIALFFTWVGFEVNGYFKIDDVTK